MREAFCYTSVMFKKFYPDAIEESAYVIDYKALYEDGYRGLIFDIDNTLVEHGAPATDRAKELIRNVKNIGFDVVVLSNNKEPRVKSFCDAVGCSYFYKCNKPMKRAYNNAMDKMHTDSATTVSVGDQIFTDVWGARRLKIKSILVKPIDKHEEIQIILKRRLEWLVLNEYRRRLNKINLLEDKREKHGN